jgi:hypothetical protein
MARLSRPNSYWTRFSLSTPILTSHRHPPLVTTSTHDQDVTASIWMSRASGGGGSRSSGVRERASRGYGGEQGRGGAGGAAFASIRSNSLIVGPLYIFVIHSHSANQRMECKFLNQMMRFFVILSTSCQFSLGVSTSEWWKINHLHKQVNNVCQKCRVVSCM